MDDEGQDEVLASQEEIEIVVYETGGSIWTQRPPRFPIDQSSQIYTLFYTQKPFTSKRRKHYPDRFGMKTVNDMGLPQYSSKDISVLETLVGQGYIPQVLVEGTEMCCKSGDDAFWQGIEREFDCLRKVARSQIANSIRVPHLVGLVTSAEIGMIIGILEEYIPSGVLSDLRELEDEGVRETVDLLHDIGVIWGDGKPHNVLIHKETDDAWELMETLEGDEQAVGKILEFLDV
ncbi:hypothetical protein BKA65DRAFT_605110 [Rhexocercosporidium sp. MPI-PUGE-AT-0058]|nr:hypothetical protein BKA65DRAFT_605110 [Rhexocercosporidium sp. MPI-PUGE-AT-0058]